MAELEAFWVRKAEEARAAGVREGEASGYARAAAEHRAAVANLARSAAELAGLQPRLRREAEADLLELSLAIARRILRRELAIDPDAIRGVILAALEKLRGREVCRVRVHPSHAEALAACLRESAPPCEVEIVHDASAEPGTAVFETERGNLDASVGSQLEEIGRGLADCLRRTS
jgi:flagellar assembly protein FliH